MISATRRWLRRNRTNLAIGLGVLGAGYVAGQYILNKISEARERMSSDRIARENLRRRFQQNQEDCTFTVLALLPTATEDILEALPVENITHELQQQKAERLGRSAATSDLAPSELSSGAQSVNGEDVKSLSSFQTESFMHTSQMAASSTDNGGSESPRPKKNKAQLWSELKISSITRSFTLIYTLSLLTLLTRIQLNLLGRRNYLSSVVSLASHPPNETTISLENNDDDRAENSYGNDFETNRKFLTFSWWLLHKGWRSIMEKVEAGVNEVFGPLNPREDVSFEKLSHLVVEVRERVEGSTEGERRNHKWLPCLLPPQDQESYVLHESGMTNTPPPTSSVSLSDPPQPTPNASTSTTTPESLRRLLDETSDLIDSPTFTHILTLLLDTLFSHLTDHALRSQAFKLPTNPQEPLEDPSLRVQEVSDSATDPMQTKAKLATILAVITRQAHAIGNGVPNTYVQAMESVRELEAFAAVVYSSNFAAEGVLAGEVDGEGVTEGGKARMVDVPEEGAAEGDLVDKGEGKFERVAADEEGNGLVARTWRVWEGVWGRVVGGGEGDGIVG